MDASIGFLPDGPVTFTFDDKVLTGKVIFSPCEARGSINFHLTRADVEALRDAVVSFLGEGPRVEGDEPTADEIEAFKALGDIDDGFDAEADNEERVREREYQESRPQTLADVGMCEADFR